MLIPALALGIGAQPVMVIDEGGKDEPFGALRLVGSREVFVVYDSAKRIFIDPEGEIIDQELHPPFAYLRSLAEHFSISDDQGCGSDQFRLGSPHETPASNDSLLAGVFFLAVHPLQGSCGVTCTLER